MKVEVQRFLIDPLPPHMPSFPRYQHPWPEWCICYNWWPYIDIISTKGIVYILVHSWSVVCPMGLDKCIMTCFYHMVLYRVFHSPKHPLCSQHSFLLLAATPQLATTIEIATLLCFALSSMSYSWTHAVCSFSDWVLSVMCIYGSFVSFHDLIVHYFLVLNNMPLSWCTSVYLSIQLMKNIMVPQFGNYELGWYKYHVQAFVWT